jgi:hypothetical protein
VIGFVPAKCECASEVAMIPTNHEPP